MKVKKQNKKDDITGKLRGTKRPKKDITTAFCKVLRSKLKQVLHMYVDRRKVKLCKPRGNKSDGNCLWNGYHVRSFCHGNFKMIAV